MERRDRKADILAMALKTSGTRNQRKCRKNLLPEFNMKSANLTSCAPDAGSATFKSSAPKAGSATLTSCAPDAGSATLTSCAPNIGSATFITCIPDAVSTTLTSCVPDARSATLTNSALDAVSTTFTSSEPDAASTTLMSCALNIGSATFTNCAPDASELTTLTSCAPNVGSASYISCAPDAGGSTTLTSCAPNVGSATFTSCAPDAGESTTLTSCAPNVGSATFTSCAPDARESTTLTSCAPNVGSATFTSYAPNAVSAICTSCVPDARSSTLMNSAPDAVSATFTSSEPDARSTTLMKISNILNAEPICVRSVPQESLEVIPSTSSANNTISPSISRITRPRKDDFYLDYMSDDEVALLNAFGDLETSDEWEPEKTRKKKKKLDVEEAIEITKESKKIRTNKRKQAAQKRLSGQSYVTKKGVVVQEKKVQPNPCLGKKCGNNCADITEERRLSIFKHFWSLSEQRRKDWIVSLTQKANIKRKRNKDSEKRTTTYKYNITDGEAHRQVCLQFLCRTIDVSSKYVYYTVSTSNEFGNAKESERGKSIPSNKTSIDNITAVENYIKCLPAVPSHYCRKDSTRIYLPAEYKNFANLYRKYKEHRTFQGQTFVSESIFRKVFNENFNIAFHIPKKDKCLKCCQYENKTDPTPEERRAYEAHLIEKDHTYNRYKMHKTIHLTDSASICISFDLQKVLNTPYGDSMLLFYTRKLAVYNAVIYENGTRNVYCYYWNESQGNRGANEMATILSQYISKLDERGSIKRLLLYCDCCPGQNRNKIVLAMLHEAVQRCTNIDSIQINFLLTGHTYMTVDSAHAVIENKVKNTTIWAPSQWYTVFQTARQIPKPFEVVQLTHKDFKKWDLLADKYFVGNLVGKISKIRVATFKKNRTSAKIKFSMDPETPVSLIEVTSKTKLLDLPDCYPTTLPITENKHRDLMKLCSDQVIPQQFQAEYLALTCDKKVKDTLPDTDIEDNVD